MDLTKETATDFFVIIVVIHKHKDKDEGVLEFHWLLGIPILENLSSCHLHAVPEAASASCLLPSLLTSPPERLPRVVFRFSSRSTLVLQCWSPGVTSQDGSPQRSCLLAFWLFDRLG